MAEVRIAGTLATELPGVISDLSWSSRWGSGPCGPDAASWSMDLPVLFDDARLVVGQSVKVVEGGQTVWSGLLTDVQRGEPWRFEAAGLAVKATDFLALDASGNPTTTISTAVSQAVTRGLPWSGSAFGSLGAWGTVDGLDDLASLLTDYHDTNGLRWGVNRYGAGFSQADDTTVRWLLDGHDVEVGVAEDELYTAVTAYYQSGTTGSPATPTYATVTVTNAAAIAKYGRREYALSLTNLGTISGATATGYATSVLNAALQPAWLNQITVTADRLTTLGGVPADLPSVRAGQAVQVYGVPDRVGRLVGSRQMVVGLGQVSYQDGSDEITIAPLRLARRTLRDVLAGIAATQSTSA